MPKVGPVCVCVCVCVCERRVTAVKGGLLVGLGDEPARGYSCISLRFLLSPFREGGTQDGGSFTKALVKPQTACALYTILTLKGRE